MTPPVGAFGVTRTDGWVGAAIRYGTRSVVNHAFVHIGHGTVVEAQPGGARLAKVDDYPHAVWSDAPHLQALRRPIWHWAAEVVVEEAVKLLGTPYGWPDIAAVALAQPRLGGLIKPTVPLHAQPWIVRRLTRPDRLICSQLVDLAYRRAGVHLFTDGRPAGLVSPGDLLTLITERTAA